jgi:hypothetical protein
MDVVPPIMPAVNNVLPSLEACEDVLVLFALLADAPPNRVRAVPRGCNRNSPSVACRHPNGLFLELGCAIG